MDQQHSETARQNISWAQVTNLKTDLENCLSQQKCCAKLALADSPTSEATVTNGAGNSKEYSTESCQTGIIKWSSVLHLVSCSVNNTARK